MIQNEVQLTIAKNSIEELRKSIDSLSNSGKTEDVLQVNAWKSRIEDLEEEIKEFESQMNDVSKLELSNDNLLKSLISMCIDSSKVQKEFADDIKVQEHKIPQYEQDNFRSSSLEMLVEILLEKD